MDNKTNIYFSDENEILKQFLEQAETVLRRAVRDTDLQQHYIELSLLVIQCLEVQCSFLFLHYRFPVRYFLVTQTEG